MDVGNCLERLILHLWSGDYLLGTVWQNIILISRKHTSYYTGYWLWLAINVKCIYRQKNSEFCPHLLPEMFCEINIERKVDWLRFFFYILNIFMTLACTASNYRVEGHHKIIWMKLHHITSSATKPAKAKLSDSCKDNVIRFSCSVRCVKNLNLQICSEDYQSGYCLKF